MKTTTTFLFFALLIVGSAVAKPTPSVGISKSKIAISKPVAVFGTFHAHRQGDFASLNWNVLSDEVTSFIIQRSYDGEFFQDIAEVTPGAARWNRYTDNTVEPGLIYYRIVAYSNGEALETSATELVKIDKHK